MRGFVQHTLPPGFQKVWHYGWMSPNYRVTLDQVKWLVWLFLGWTYWLASGHVPQETPRKKPPVCRRECGGKMHVVAVSYHPVAVLPEHSVPYLDSG